MKVGTKVRIVTTLQWKGTEGKVVAKVKESAIDGHKQKRWIEYIVQFKNPATWSFFTREELRKI